MKNQTLIKLIRILKTARLVKPLAIILLGLFAGIHFTEDAGEPGGDPIEDDPVPF